MKVRKIDSTGLSGDGAEKPSLVLGASSPLKGVRARKAWVCPAGVDSEKLDEEERETQCRSVTLAELEGASVGLEGLRSKKRVSLREMVRRGVEFEDCEVEGREMRCTIRGLQPVDEE